MSNKLDSMLLLAYPPSPPHYPPTAPYDPYRMLKDSSIRVFIILLIGTLVLAVIGSILISTSVGVRGLIVQRNVAQEIVGWLFVIAGGVQGIAALLWLLLIHMKINPNELWYMSSNLRLLRYIGFVAYPFITKFEQQLAAQVYGGQYQQAPPPQYQQSQPQPYAPTPPIYTCPRCGNQIQPGAPICPYCGFQFQQPQT